MALMRDDEPRALTLRTAHGRVVSYYEFGDADGVPVLALHGTPASGASFAWADAAARARGVRLIAPDRPGIGHSDRVARHERATVAQFAPAILDAVDALGVRGFSVLGYSGGGPYAVAIAAAAAERVHAGAIVSGAGQVGVWASSRDFERTDRNLTRLALRAPALARAALLLTARGAALAPRAAALLSGAEMSRRDRQVLRELADSRAALAA
ncbi:MAG TPA: alpha/beta hydrolase, partial [Acidimicrobiia bacterium]|nr:alpha/beta hydrolase [Acidimicrobiia bacterium]